MIGLNKIGLNQVQLNRLHLNAPFPTYRKMAGGSGSGDGFPVLPGDVTRWHFGGLTNEMMAAMDDPRLEDADGKGRFLSFKNFAWSGMSGSNGYTQNFNQYAGLSGFDKTVNDSSIKVFIPQDNNSTSFYDSKSREIGYTYNFYIKITGIENRELRVINGTEGGTVLSIKQDGVYLINTTVSDDWGQNRLYFSFPKAYSNNTIAIEQLPLYPGALVFDGIDDYGTCDNFPILTKEKGYTVVALRQWINEKTNQYLIVNRDSFIMEANLNNKWVTASFSSSNNFIDLDQQPFVYQSTYSYNGITLNNVGSNNGSNVITIGCNNHGIGSFNSYANVAIWEVVILDHDATEEELSKIKDYFVKTYPWLFFDQAWTVAGKTNEDADRDTIANITGNGNDLVLSNFSFSKSSGYGMYQQDFNQWVKPASRIDATIEGSTVFRISSIKQANIIQLYYQSGSSQQPFVVPAFKIKISGLTDEQKLRYQYRENDVSAYVNIDTDGIYDLPSFDFLASGNVYGFIFSKVQETCDITIEQIPEYEGYLVTDGVEDKIVSSAFDTKKDFTAVGEWNMLSNATLNPTMAKGNSFLLEYKDSLFYTYINQLSYPKAIDDTNSIKALCSDGRMYLKDWQEAINDNEQTSKGNTDSLFIGANKAGTKYSKMAFKNIAIYPTVLSKEDCIKAYSYIQTLKAK